MGKLENLKKGLNGFESDGGYLKRKKTRRRKSRRRKSLRRKGTSRVR